VRKDLVFSTARLNVAEHMLVRDFPPQKPGHFWKSLEEEQNHLYLESLNTQCQLCHVRIKGKGTGNST
jgi:hypothetical protein